jgi:NAD(P)-dependent dehydrogenase (short-subunit alcohol dehydrogenase family)
MAEGMFEGKTVIISGVGPGLGRETAMVAAREGANVVLAARSEDKLAAVAADVEATGAKVIHRRTDIGVPEDRAALVAAAVDTFGGIDALVNNAAFEATFGGLEATPESDFEKAIQTNLLSTLGLTREALPHLKASRGAIVFVGSQTMFKPPPESMQIAYAASKGALLGASRHLAIEVGSAGVRVNTVAPGWMWGPPVEFFVNYTAEQQKTSPEEVIKHLTAPMAMDFFATDGDVAEVIGFFASSRAKGVTGQTIMVNAGETMM